MWDQSVSVFWSDNINSSGHIKTATDGLIFKVSVCKKYTTQPHPTPASPSYWVCSWASQDTDVLNKYRTDCFVLWNTDSGVFETTRYESNIQSVLLVPVLLWVYGFIESGALHIKAPSSLIVSIWPVVSIFWHTLSVRLLTALTVSPSNAHTWIIWAIHQFYCSLVGFSDFSAVSAT